MWFIWLLSSKHVIKIYILIKDNNNQKPTNPKASYWSPGWSQKVIKLKTSRQTNERVFTKFHRLNGDNEKSNFKKVFSPYLII